jgi:hypothetical protein
MSSGIVYNVVFHRRRQKVDTFKSYQEMATANAVVEPQSKRLMSLFTTENVESNTGDVGTQMANTTVDVSVDNMTQVEPKVQVADKQLQDRIRDVFIGAYPKEYETPHVTIRQRNKGQARLLLKTGEVMESTKVDKDIIKAVQADMKVDPTKYARNWNENNPEHAIPIKEEKQHELPKKDEAYKEAAWYKEQQRLSQTYEKGQG